jgi:hypothetical protein
VFVRFLCFAFPVSQMGFLRIWKECAHWICTRTLAHWENSLFALSLPPCLDSFFSHGACFFAEALFTAQISSAFFLFFSLLLCSSLLHSTLCYPFSLFSFCYSSPPFLLPFSFILFATPVCSVLLVSFILCSAFLFSPPSSLPSSSLLFSFLVFPPRLYPLIISCVDHPVSLSPRINGHS